MPKKILSYILPLVLLAVGAVFFTRTYKALTNYAAMANRTNAVYNGFQNLSKHITSAAIINPALLKAEIKSSQTSLFYTDSTLILKQLSILQSSIKDTINVSIANQLEKKIRLELRWLLNSNVADSVVKGTSPRHIAALHSIDSLISAGINRTNFLVGQHEKELQAATRSMLIWLAFLILSSGVLSIYTNSNLLSQRSETRKKEAELAAANRLLKNAQHIGNMGNWEFSRSLQKRHWSEEMYRIWAIPYDTEITRDFFVGMIYPDDRIKVEVAQRAFFDMQSDLDIEYRIVAGDGSNKVVHHRGKLVKDPQGDVLAFEGTVQDITERVRVESELNEASREKEIALNRVNDAVISLDNEWRYTFLNDAAIAAHPKGRSHALGKKMWEVHPDIKQSPFWPAYERAKETGKVQELEDFYEPLSTWFHVKVFPSSNGITIFYTNITERKNSEAVLAQSLKEVEDYKFALDESSIVAITDQKGVIKYVNDNFCKISKYSRQELIGQDHRIINSGYHPKEFIRDLWATIAKGGIWRGDLKNKAKDGSTYWVETTIVPFLDHNEKPYQYVAIRSDITQKKEWEVQMQKNMHELERSNKELEQFAYIASHDLQEPLRMVGSYMQLLEKRYKGKLDEDADEFIHYAVDGAKRMKQLIGDLLNYSRVNREGSIEPIYLNEVMRDVLQNLSATIKEKKAIINYPRLPMIRADKTQMVQLFQNLISNSLKFVKEEVQPVVEITAQEQEGAWLFGIKDNGIGIEAQYSDKIFIIFKQLHSKSQYSGTGIGLAVAKKIVEKYGGSIWFESEPGEGATFFFTLKTEL